MAMAVMAARRAWRQHPYVPPLSMAIPVTIFSVAALALPLAAARALELSAPQLGSWLLALYGLPAVLSLVLTRRYRQPLLVAWHTQGRRENPPGSGGGSQRQHVSLHPVALPPAVQHQRP